MSSLEMDDDEWDEVRVSHCRLNICGEVMADGSELYEMPNEDARQR